MKAQILGVIDLFFDNNDLLEAEIEDAFANMHISKQVPPELLQEYFKSFIDSAKEQVFYSINSYF